MALSYKARRRWSVIVLLVGLPLYIVVAVTLADKIDRNGNILVELLVYVVLGFLWMIPLRGVFLGVGKPDPDTPQDAPQDALAGKPGRDTVVDTKKAD